MCAAWLVAMFYEPPDSQKYAMRKQQQHNIFGYFRTYIWISTNQKKASYFIKTP